MKKNVWLIAAVVLASAALFVSLGSFPGLALGRQSLQAGGAPGVVSYQGQVLTSGIPYDGTGYFKFAIVDAAGTNSYWSNDGTSSTGDEPTASISLVVDQGLFSLFLGDTSLSGMSMALDETIFSDPDTYLRMWFSDDDATFTQLDDQKIASVPYALQAQVALDADSLGGVDSSGYQLQVTGSCPVGYAVREINGDGSVTCELVEGRPGFTITTYSDSVNSYGDPSSIAIGVDDLGLVSYKTTPDYDLMVGHCHDVACTSMTANAVATTGSVGGFNSITIGGDGLGLIAHAYSNTKVLVSHCNDIACTSADTYEVSTGSKTAYYIDIATGSDGYGLIAWSDFSTGPWAVKVAHCTNADCSASDVYIVDNTTPVVGRNLSLAIGSDDLGLISYSDYGSEDLHVAHCSNTACSASTHAPIDTAGNVGGTNAITIGTDGLGLIAYGTSTSIKVAHCQNVLCTAADITIIDPSSNPSGTAITIGADGLGLIGYYIDNTWQLFAAHCSNTLCSAVTLQLIDPLARGSSGFGLTIGADGMPLFSYRYYDGSQDHLKILQCSNRFCLPYNPGW